MHNSRRLDGYRNIERWLSTADDVTDAAEESDREDCREEDSADPGGEEGNGFGSVVGGRSAGARERRETTHSDQLMLRLS